MWTSAIRILKLVALLGFALPWFAISCANRPVIEPRGYELALGLEIRVGEEFRYQADAEGLVQPAAYTPAQAPANPRGWKPHAAVQALAAFAFLALAGALVAGFFLRERMFHLISAGAGFAAAGLAFSAVFGVKLEVDRQLQQGEQGIDPAFSGMATSMLKFSFEPGVWVTVAAAALASVAACVALAMAQRRAPSKQGP